jgi:tRNA threonylcarbamoyl adenosine modification protein (Sua5/YciO/YrdC/YwlC family)
MQTDLVQTSTAARREKAVARAVDLLRKGELVALPTETVYGLAADALKAIAVAKIFEAKERPRFDPLIVHLPSRDWLEKLVDVSGQDRQLILKLADKFWPGPFTMVLQKREIVPEIVTAGLDTVAVRISAHPVFAGIVRELNKPLAAPSANRFGRVSPTTAQHVMDELGGRIPFIIDAGPTQHGIESTIVTVRDSKIDILRRGPITEEDLRGLGFQPTPYRQDADATSAGFQPMDPYKEVQVHRGFYLPHWTQEGATYAVTFRLADALPANVVADWESERREILDRARKQERELTGAEERRLAELFSQKVESYLDAGHGKCWLRDERVAKIVRDALLYFEGKRYHLVAWCIMPNHVHVIVHPLSGYTPSEILHTWKSFTANKANRLLHRRGNFWQPESYDHLIRNEQDLRNQVRYVLENPQMASLEPWPWVASGIGLQPMSDRQDADATTRVRAPGQLPVHYAPKTPLRLIDNGESFSPKKNQRIGLLAWHPISRKGDLQIAQRRTGDRRSSKFVAIRHFSEKQDLREAAANLFRYMRELDALSLDLIVAERVPSRGLGAAILDRLERASHDQPVAPGMPE